MPWRIRINQQAEYRVEWWEQDVDYPLLGQWYVVPGVYPSEEAAMAALKEAKRENDWQTIWP